MLGAGGTIAPAIVRDLAESDEVSGVLLLIDPAPLDGAEAAERRDAAATRAATGSSTAATCS